MIDIKYIKENPEEVIERLRIKGKEAREEIEQILALDNERRNLIAETEAIKAEQNRTNKLIPQYKKEGKDVSEIFAKMKEMDFSKVDVMTIAYGVNDYTAYKGLDNASNPKDVEYYGGALRYSLEKILNAYPNIRVVIVTPCWCFWPDGNGGVIEDSDTRYYNLEQDTLAEFAKKCVEIGNEYHIPVVDAYKGLSINKFNHSHWFNAGDGIHPNEKGRKALAKLMGKTICGM